VDSYSRPRYSGILDCGRKILAAHGARGLWKGFGPALARSFPANAACFAVYEASQQLISELLGL
jgi:solute carrier family 25 carnitine/acylcarnitine transporter 20/29